MDKAAALPIATSTPATNLRQYINSDLGYNDLKFQLLCSKIATVNSFEVVISNGLSFYRLHITFLYQMSFENSDRAVYSDLNPRDGGQSLYPTSTVFGNTIDFKFFHWFEPNICQAYYQMVLYRKLVGIVKIVFQH